MTIPSQEYAGLANDVYQDRRVGVRGPNEEERVTLNGVDYRIREHVDNARNGYQGTIYQRVDSGEIVVAHRGTEQIWKDGVIADGAMVANRTNPQANDAIALTRRALEYARQDGMEAGARTPQVTVTGHSLGGTLAQVSAHHFDLRGETFNAYGAASLDRRIPEGGNRVVNHVMAADAVSAASPHYGEVRTYATPREITTLNQSGYRDNPLADFVTPDLPLVAAGRSFGSHSMHNFLPVDGDGKPDRSALQDPAARARAQEHSRMIENYRGDVETLRQGVTIGSRGAGGLIRDGIDHIRGPLPAGEPAAREDQERQRRGAGVSHSSLDTGREGVPGERTGAQTAQVAAAGTQQDHVSRLLEAARSGPDALRTATQDLQASDVGRAWQQQADSQAQVLAQRDAAQQNAPQAQEPARMG